MEIKHSDKLFSDSPYAGELECICSRCAEIIQDDEVPIRMWTQNEKGEVDENSQEYRFCERCQEKSGIILLKTDNDYYEE